MVDCAEAHFERSKKMEKNQKFRNPLLLAPPENGVVPEDYLDLVSIETKNEEGNEAGLFGWCVISRKKADFYCKDSRLPIHSINEKIAFLEKEAALESKNKS